MTVHSARALWKYATLKSERTQWACYRWNKWVIGEEDFFDMYQRQECWNETSSWELETGDRFPSRCFRVSSLDCLICRVWTQQTGTLTILRSLWQPDNCFYLMLVFSELHLQGLIMRSFSVKVCSAYWVSTVQLSEMSHDWLCSIAGNPINAFSALHCGKLALSLFHHCTFCFCSTVNVNCEYLLTNCMWHHMQLRLNRGSSLTSLFPLRFGGMWSCDCWFSPKL